MSEDSQSGEVSDEQRQGATVTVDDTGVTQSTDYTYLSIRDFLDCHRSRSRGSTIRCSRLFSRPVMPDFDRDFADAEEKEATSRSEVGG